MRSNIILTIFLWFSLPLILLVIIAIFEPSSTSKKPLFLFVMYMSFSWTIAVLIFIMESARQQLFNNITPVRSALRLGIYGSIATILALVASPESGLFSTMEKFIVVALVFVYGGMMGFASQRISASNRK